MTLHEGYKLPEGFSWHNSEPPAATRNSGVSQEIAAISAVLQENPGNWARAYADLKPATASNRAAKFRAIAGLEAVVRGGDVYVRFLDN